MPSKKDSKPFPTFKTDEEAARFVDTADLSEYDFSEFKPMRFEFKPKDEQVNMRVPADLLQAVKALAAKQGMPYQRFIRQTLEDAVNKG